MPGAGNLAYAAALTKEQREKLSPEDIIKLMKKGNERFRQGKESPHMQLGNLTGLLGKIRPAVDATQYQGERSATNYGFVDAVARKNVELTMADIHRRSPVLANLETSGAIKTVGAMYNL